MQLQIHFFVEISFVCLSMYSIEAGKKERVVLKKFINQSLEQTGKKRNTNCSYLNWYESYKFCAATNGSFVASPCNTCCNHWM